MVYALDPDGTREYLMNITTRTIHGTDSTDPACEPQAGDAVGYGDDYAAFLAQMGTLTICPLCVAQELFPA